MIPPLTPKNQKRIIPLAVVVILASAAWIYYSEFKKPDINLPLHQAVGHVMAEETSRIVGHGGRILIVTAEAQNAPELKAQVQTFEKDLKRLGITVKNKITLDPADNAKYRPGAGLSAKHFLKIAKKGASVDAIVSFVGAPRLSDAELAQLKATTKFIAETHSPERLLNLFDKKILSVGIVPRFEFPAPGPRKPQTSRQWFDHYFQIVTPEALLPKPDESP